jgi:hypothetical protein
MIGHMPSYKFGYRYDNGAGIDFTFSKLKFMKLGYLKLILIFNGDEKYNLKILVRFDYSHSALFSYEFELSFCNYFLLKKE